MNAARILPFIVLLLAAPVTASDPVGDGTDPEWHTEPRLVSATWDREGFLATSTATGERNDTVTLRFDEDSDSLTLSLEDHMDQGSPIHAEFILHLVALVEFQDRDGDGAYGLGDTVVERQEFADASRPRITGVRLDDGGYGLAVRYAFPSIYPASFTWSFHLEPNGTAPAWITSEMALDRFSFQSDNQTRLALETRAFGARIQAPDRVGVESGPGMLFWTWNNTAASDGTEAEVFATLQPYAAHSGEETLVVLSHGRNASLQHGMTFGAVREAPPVLPLKSLLGDWRIYLVGSVLTLGAVGLTVKYVLKEDRRAS